MGRNQPKDSTLSRRTSTLALAVERSAPVGLVAVGNDGCLLYANATFCRMVGWSEDELIGQRAPFPYWSKEHAPELEARFRKLIEQGGSSPYDGIFRRRNGEEFVVDIAPSPLLDDAGNRLGWIAAVCDATDRVKALEERARLTDQLVHAQKMEAVGRLAGGVAHDFNNLLSVIVNATEFIAEEATDLGPCQEDVDEILKAAGRASALTRQLLVFSRREITIPAIVDINVVLSSLEKLLRRTIGEDVTLTCRTAREPLLVKMDSGHLEQAIMNLVINARDATPSGGSISLSSARLDLDPGSAERLGNLHPGPFVTIEVADTGTGMSADVLARVFDPFFTTKPAGKGTGLGLSIVYGIVQEAGGHVSVSSEVGRGTRIRIHLPACSQSTSATHHVIAPLPAGNGELVLLVEDEEAVLALTRRLLLRSGYEVIVARDGMEALSVFERESSRIRLLVTDVVMPHMLGTELAAQLRETHPQLGVVFLSGYLEGIDLEAIASMGAELVPKPIMRDRLLAALRNAAGGSLYARPANESA